MEPVQRDATYRYMKGQPHRRGRKETRGAPRALSLKDIQKMTRARRKLLKRAGSEKRVTYEDIFAEAGMEDKANPRTKQDALRAKGVRFRTPRTQSASKSR